MAKKTYKTYTLKGLDFHFKDKDGKSVVVVFRGGVQIDSTARYTTSSPEIQEALEKSAGFGRDYYIESVKDDDADAAPVAEATKAEAPKVEKAVMDEYKDSRRFRNLVEMKAAMEECGIPVAPDMTYTQAKAACAREGYDFQIKK